MHREPTSHERQSGQPWDASYRDGPAPWELGHPQPAIVRLAEAGAFTGAVLDAGCGTGEHALHLAARGLEVVGVDVAATAIEIARARAVERGLDARFDVADALALDRLGRTFDTVLDCGLFHTFDGEERRAYVASLAAVTRPGGTVFLHCFRDAEPAGPHPVSEAEIRDAFADWTVVSVAPTVVETRFAPAGVPAWIAQIERS